MPAAENSLRMTTTATMASLPDLMALADRACDAAKADDGVRYAVRLLVEEVCVNVISYGYPAGKPGPIELTLHWQPGRMTIQIDDRAGAFSPDDAPTPDLESDWSERSLGGLGWHLVRSMADEIEHTCLPGAGNRYTMVKKIGATSA